MAKITISEHQHLETFPTSKTPAYARITCSQAFTNEDDETVGASSPKSNEYVKQVAVTYANGVSQIAAFSGANRIDSSMYYGDSINAYVLATYTLSLHTANGKWITNVYEGLIVPRTPTTTTWADINVYSHAYDHPFRHTYYTADQVNDLLEDIDVAPMASKSIYGKNRHHQSPVNALLPVAVSARDYLDSYAEGGAHTQAVLATAITAIGATQRDLVISEEVAITATVSIPSNIRIIFEAEGKFNVSAAQILTINSMEPLGAKQVFSGAGRVVFGSGATGGPVNLAWYASLSAALTSISSTSTELLITSPVTVASNTSIPSTTLVTFEGNGSVSVNGGVTLTINRMTPHPAVQIFSGAGNVVLGANAVRGPVYLSWYASLSAALTSIGATQTELVITNQVTVASNTSVPATTVLIFAGDGSVTVNTGITLTINAMRIYPAQRIFYGAGNVVFGQNATGGYFRLEWYMGVTSAADCTAAMANLMTSVTNNEGGTIHIGPGTWTMSDVAVASYCTIKGAGKSYLSTVGTVLAAPEILGPTNVAILKATGAFRNIHIEDLTISTAGSFYSYCLLAEGTAGNSAFGLSCTRVMFHGDGTITNNCPPQVFIQDSGGAHSWECIQANFIECNWITTEDSVGFQIDTVNSLVNFQNCVNQTGRAGTAVKIVQGGWINIHNPDWRGASYVPDPTNTLDRQVSGSITSGTKLLTLTTGTFVENDLGQPIVRIGSVGNPNYIVDITSATTATLYANASATIAAQTIDIYRWGVFPNLAYACIHIVGDHRNLNISGAGADEGYQWYIVNDSNQQQFPVVVQGQTVQADTQINQSMHLVLKDNFLKSCSFQDAAAAQAHIERVGNSIYKQTTRGPLDLFITRPRLWGARAGSSFTRMELDYAENVFEQKFRYPTAVYNDERGGVFPDDPVFRVLSRAVPGQPKWLMHLGDVDLLTERDFVGYRLRRDNISTGFLEFDCNQTSKFRGYQFDSCIGYDPAQGVDVTQTGSRSDTVTANAIHGKITTHDAAIPAGTRVAFVVFNSFIQTGDIVHIDQIGGETNGTSIAYKTYTVAGQFAIQLINHNTVTADTQAMQIQFWVIKRSGVA